MKHLNRHPWSWLLIGGLLFVLSQQRFGLGFLAWLSPIPWLHYLRHAATKWPRAALTGTIVAAAIVSVLKIVTDPLPAVAALGYGVPIGLAHALPFAAWDWTRRKLGTGFATLVFPATLVLAEWSMHGLLPLGTWGAMVNTQLDQLALLQLTSVTGPHGVSFLMALVAAVGERALSGERRTLKSAAVATAGLVLSVVAIGQLRLTLAHGSGQPIRRVAAVGTDSTVGTKPDLPSLDESRRVEEGLVARTEQAAASGADLIVWNEAAITVRPSDDADWQGRLQSLARRLKIDLVAAYVVPLQDKPLRYENKYVFVRPDGTIDHTYFKHEPVPGEPAVRGTGPMPQVEGPADTVVSGAICYDYDFPRLGLRHARLGADMIVLPSSDWRGIAPLHTEMATLRAIEGGHSVLRSTRFGLSAGIDPWGRIRAWSSHFDDERRILVVDLPVSGTWTVYGTVGDWFPLTCLFIALATIVVALRRRVGSAASVIASGRGDNHPVSGFSRAGSGL